MQHIQKANLSFSRALIKQLGLMNGVRPLQSGEKFDLSLSILDRTHSRDKIKIGVIYVKEDQTE